MTATASVRSSFSSRVLVVFGIVGLAGVLALPDRTASGQTPPAKKAGKAGGKQAPKSEKPAAQPEAATHLPQVEEIDKQIETQWKANKITPSVQASDFEFIRRASLDIIGRIATVEEIRQFINDKGTTQARRARLIDRLLDSPAYAENWAGIWSVWLLTRSSPRDRSGRQIYLQQLEIWLYDQFAEKGRGWDKIVNDLLTATGISTENGAVNYVLAHVGEATGKDREEGRFNFVPLTSRTTRLFLGLQTQCTQCHDHPMNPQWKQKHFWGVNAFFRQVEKVGGGMMRGRMEFANKIELRENPDLNVTNAVFYENRKAVGFSVRPTFLEGQRYDPKAGKTRRQFLAELITHDEYFAKAYVNRMWGHFFGRGLTVNGKDVDDFGEHNPETHPLTEDTAKAMKAKHPDKFKDKEPALLDFLADEFRSSPTNHDSRALIRWICNSRAYNLTSVANGSIELAEDEDAAKNGDKKKVAKKQVVPNDRAEAEPFFSRMQLKAMSPEQLFESLWVSTYANPRAVTKKSKEDQRRLRNEWMRRLTVSFGDDEGNEATFNGTVVQALLLMNGREINEAIEDQGGPVHVALVIGTANRKGLAGVIEELYLATLNRQPTRVEMLKISKDISLVLTGTKDRKEFWEKAGQDLLWAILNSNEFILNH